MILLATKNTRSHEKELRIVNSHQVLFLKMTISVILVNRKACLPNNVAQLVDVAPLHLFVLFVAKDEVGAK
jgi:hypothetical protein